MDAMKLTGDVLRITGEILSEKLGPKLMDKVIELRQFTLTLQELNAALQGRIISLQEEKDSLRRKVREAEALNQKTQDWKALANHFPLILIEGNIVVRRGRHPERPNEPPHNLCANCFEIGKYSPFQRTAAEPKENGDFLDTLTCPACGNHYQHVSRHY